MQRFLYFAGFVYIALCGTFVVRQIAARTSVPDPVASSPTHAPPSQPPAYTSGAQWFAAMKQYCNPVEVDVRARYTPPPATSDGAGYAAACFALAGKIDRARTIIEGIAPAERAAAAGVLFEVAHPVADAGDDRASGPDDGARARLLAEQLHGALSRRHVRVLARADATWRRSTCEAFLATVHAGGRLHANARQARAS